MASCGPISLEGPVDPFETRPRRRGCGGCITTLVGLGIVGLLVCVAGQIPVCLALMIPAERTAPVRPVLTPDGPAPTPGIVTPPPPPSRMGVPVAEASPGRWLPLPDPLPSPLAAFDGLGAVTWGTSVARQWQPDATLTVVFLTHVRPDGLLDLANDAEAAVDLRFVSPRQHAHAAQVAQVAEQEVPTGFRIWITKGEARYMLTTVDLPGSKGGPDADWAPFEGFGEGCNAGRVLSVVEADGRVPRRPYYDMRMDWRWPVKGWAITTDPGEGMLRPSDCGWARR